MIYLIHHPRTGGSYFESAIKSLGIEIIASHYPDWDLIRESGCKTFTIVRHPSDRQASIKRVNAQYPQYNDRFDHWELYNGIANRVGDHDIDHWILTQDIDAIFADFHLDKSKLLADRFPDNGKPWRRPLIRTMATIDQLLYDLARSQFMGCCKKRVKHAADGIKGLAKAAMRIDRADDVTIEARRVICRSCIHALPCKNRPEYFCRCKVCGCLLRAKTSLAGERCPENKW